MPDSRKEMELDIEIMGKLDPSVMATINAVKAQLDSMGADARTRNEVLKRAYSQMFDHVGQSAKGMEGKTKGVFRNMVDAAGRAAHAIEHSFVDTFKEIGGEVAKGLGFGVGFSIPGMVGGGIEATKEFGAQALEIRGEREALQTQLANILKSQGKPLLTPQIDTMLRNIEGREVPEKYTDLLKATTMLFSAAPSKFANVDQLHTMLTQLADISRTPEAFSLATQAFTRMLAEGKVDAAHLRELAVDTGYNFKGAMADVLKVTPDELSTMIKKGNITGEQAINALFGAFEKITGPGGPAYQHADAQLSGLKGLQARWEGHMDDFKESFGKQLENFLRPVMDQLFEYLTPAELTTAFDRFSNLSKGLGDSVAYLMNAVVKGPSAAEIKGIGDAFSQLFTKMLGGAPMTKTVLGYPGGEPELTVLTPGFQAELDTIANNIKTVLEGIKNTVQFIATNWETIRRGMGELAAVWGAKKVYDIAKGFTDALKGVGLMNVSAGVVNVSGGVAGAGKVAETVEKTTEVAKTGALLTAGGTLAATAAGLGFTWGVSKLGDVIGDKIQKTWFPTVGAGQTPEGEHIKEQIKGRTERITGGGDPLRYNQAIADSWAKMSEEQRKSSGYSEDQIKTITTSKQVIESQVDANKRLSATVTSLNATFASLGAMTAAVQAQAKGAPKALPPVPVAPPTAVPAITPSAAGPKPTPPAVSDLGAVSGATASISTSITSIADALANAPSKATETSSHLDSVASTFSTLPGKASSISSSLSSLVAAINSAVSQASASIHAAATSAAANMIV